MQQPVSSAALDQLSYNNQSAELQYISSPAAMSQLVCSGAAILYLHLKLFCFNDHNLTYLQLHCQKLAKMRCLLVGLLKAMLRSARNIALRRERADRSLGGFCCIVTGTVWSGQAGAVPVSDTVETQAAKQLQGPAVIHAKSLQQLADPSPTGQPLVVNDRSIQSASGLQSSDNPLAVRSARSPTADEIHGNVRNCKWQYGATLLLLLSMLGLKGPSARRC